MDILTASLDRHFAELHGRSLGLVAQTSAEILFEKVGDDIEAAMKLNIAGNIVRSAAIVEIMCGGITSRLWDDPFEWTLPEEMDSDEKITEYLREVESARRNAFCFIASDADLSRSIPAPRELRPLGDILVDTIAKAEHYQGRAFALYQAMSGDKVAIR